MAPLLLFRIHVTVFDLGGYSLGKQLGTAFFFLVLLFLSACGADNSDVKYVPYSNALNGVNGNASGYNGSSSPFYFPPGYGSNTGTGTTSTVGNAVAVDPRAMQSAFGSDANQILALLTAMDTHDDDLNRVSNDIGLIFAMLAKARNDQINAAIFQLAKQLAAELAELKKNSSKDKKKSWGKRVKDAITGLVKGALSILG